MVEVSNICGREVGCQEYYPGLDCAHVLRNTLAK